MIKDGSVLIGMKAADGANPETVKHIVAWADRGWGGKEPVDYPDTVIRHIRELYKLQREVAGIWIGKNKRVITESSCVAMKETVRSAFNEHGTIEGQLSTLSERGNIHVIVYEPVWDKAVRCAVPHELRDKIKEFWGKRVAVHGMVHYRADGFPTSVDADSIEAFPDDKDLPSYMDVLGILRAG